MKIKGISHIGIAAKDPSRFRSFMTEILGLSPLGSEWVKDQKTLTEFYPSGHQVDVARQETRLELLSPKPELEGPISQFLDKKGGGIHHLALRVESLESALAELKAKGVRLIDEVPRAGAHQSLIAFIHPKESGGVLIELVQDMGA